MNPSMIIVWILGLALALDTAVYDQLWFQLKFAFVLGLSGYHGWMASYSAKLATGTRSLTGKTLRMLNEVPGVAAAVIVILVIVRPFGAG